MSTSTRKFIELKRKADALPPEERTVLQAEVQRELDEQIQTYERSLRDVRRARKMTQVELAGALDVSQAQVSRIEGQADLYLSTLVRYVEAMGGRLELSARFADDDEPVALTIGEIAKAGA